MPLNDTLEGVGTIGNVSGGVAGWMVTIIPVELLFFKKRERFFVRKKW